MSIEDLDARVKLAISIATLLGLLLGYLRWVKPRIARASRTTNAVIDTLIGREAITDPANGRVLSPAQPGIGVRLSTLEEAITTLAHQDKRIDALEHDVSVLQAAEEERKITRAESLTHLMMLAKASGEDVADLLAEAEK